MKICIHQPVYYPWIGSIHKILFADRYVLFDDSPAVRPSWMNRVRILMQGEQRWLSVPILFSHSEKKLVRDIRINTVINWETKHLRTLQQYYSKAPYYEELMELLKPLQGKRHQFLIDLDLASMEQVFRLLGMDVDMVYSSELDCTRQGKNSRLAHMVQAANGSVYVNGMGADSYFNDAPFKSLGIDVHQQVLPVQEYAPFNAEQFVPGLSILDVVANIGIVRIRELLAENDKFNTPLAKQISEERIQFPEEHRHSGSAFETHGTNKPFA